MNLAKASTLPATAKWQLPWCICYFLQLEWGKHPLIYTPTLIQSDQNKGPHTNRPNSADKTRLWTQHSFHTLRNLSSVWRHSIPEGPGAAASILPIYFERRRGGKQPRKKKNQAGAWRQGQNPRTRRCPHSADLRRCRHFKESIFFLGFTWNSKKKKSTNILWRNVWNAVRVQEEGLQAADGCVKEDGPGPPRTAPPPREAPPSPQCSRTLAPCAPAANSQALIS